MDDESRDSEYQNFVAIYRGFAYVGEKLEPYTNHTLETTHQRIYRTLAGLPPCSKECSRVYKCQFTQWCKTCGGWRNELLKTRRSRNVAWEQTRSWEWPKSSKNIAEVYLPISWQNDNPDYKDISTACYIWENSTDFGLRHFVIKKLRLFRNQYFAHNTALKATELEKARVFDILKDLVRSADVQGHIDVQDCLNDLAKIEEGFQVDKWMNEVQNLLQAHGLTLTEIERCANDTKESQDRLRKDQCDLQRNILKSQAGFYENIKEGQENIRKEIEDHIHLFKKELHVTLRRKHSRFSNLYKHVRYFSNRNKANIAATVIILLLGILILNLTEVIKLPTMPSEKLRIERLNTDCFSEQYSLPFPQDIPLLGYLHEHKTFVGRQWLMEEMQHELIQSGDRKQHGVVLVAEMGYGKSAFVSKLLCPRSLEIAIEINRHIVAFHLCRFDVSSTRTAVRFIKRLVGFFAKKSAEYGNIISMLPDTHILFNTETCEKEPEACFDQGISLPIKQLSSVTDDPWIVILDAIDECENNGDNPILKLLSSRIKQLPRWLKFVITSRNITSLTLLRKLKLVHLYSDDTRNTEDIKSFIKESFPTLISQSIIENLVSKSEGNFVYVIQAIKWIKDNKDNETVPDFPSDLGDVYEINFDRQFNDEEAFTIPRLILEIVCSTINPVSKLDIYKILRSKNSSLDIKQFDKAFNSLSFFLRIDSSYVQVSHQALHHWLIDAHNQNYRISIKIGHALISRYLFSSMNGSDTKDIVDLAIHVANSADHALKKMFISSKFSESDLLRDAALVHKLVWKTPSAEALELLLHHCPDVNVVNEGNVTPAFVAASKGHIDQLIILHRKGTDLRFSVKGSFFISLNNVFAKIELMKRDFYSGYGLLHIAAQHGHSSVVKYVLNYDKSLLYFKNAMGLHAGHVACENGHLEVIKILYSFEPKLFGYKCMFYAAKQNHIHILKWLVKNGVVCKCISNNESQKASKNILQLNFEYQFAYFHGDNFYENINPLDFWWIVFQTTPLMAAIKIGSVDTATYLIETFPESTNCHDAFGYTPALASVFYNRTELFPFLSKNLETDKCGKVPDHLKKLSVFQELRFEEMLHLCREDGSLAHLVALYALDKGIISYILRQRLDISWNEADKFGNFPVHYAVSSNNIVFIMLFEDGTLTGRNILDTVSYGNGYSYMEIKAANGSNAYHLAAMSSEILIMYHLTGSFKERIPEVKDNYGRGIMHYLVLRRYGKLFAGLEMETHQSSLHMFRYMIEISKHDVLSCDNFGRNVLHYSLKNGHALIVQHLQLMNKKLFDTMLSQKDNEGLTPFGFSLKYNRKREIFISPKKCAFFDGFFSYCQTESKNILMSWELGLLYVIQTASDIQYKNLIEPNIELIIEKSPYLLTAVLVYNIKVINIDHLKRKLMSSQGNEHTVRVHLSVARHIPQVFHSCKKSLLNSTLHYLMLSLEHRFSVFSVAESDIDNFLYMVYSYPTNFSLFGCPDENGYNIFHYSLIGGNIQTARILMSKNISMVTDRIKLKDVFLMAMSSRQKLDRQNYINCGKNITYHTQDACCDTFFVEFLKRNSLKVTINDFCKPGSRELSMVHLLAVNGMIRTLEVVAKRFGKKVLSCQNRDGLTPLYFSKLFSQTATESFIGRNNSLVIPHVQAEEWLIWSILNKFPQKNSSNPLFYFANSMYPVKNSYKEILNTQNVVTTLLQNPLAFGYSHISCQLAFEVISNHISIIIPFLRILESMYSNPSVYSINCVHHLYNIKSSVWMSDSFRLFLQECHMSLKHMLDKIDFFFKRFTHFYQRLEMHCHQKQYDFKVLRVNLLQFIISLKKHCFNLNQVVANAAVSFYIQDLKSVQISVPNTHTFLQLRMKALKFKEDVGFSFLLEPLPLIAVDMASLFEYRYMNIIKPSLAYKHLKDKLIIDMFGLAKLRSGLITSKSYVIENIMLKHPFTDLE